MGVIIPPIASLAYILTVCTAHVFGLTTADYLIFPLSLATCCAYLGAFTEYKSRLRANIFAQKIEQWYKSKNTTTDITLKIIFLALAERFILKFILFSGCFTAIYAIMHSMLTLNNGFPYFAGLNWQILLLLATPGAILALRIKKAYISFLITAIGLISWQFYTNFL